jgi:hypothetical protein
VSIEEEGEHAIVTPRLLEMEAKAGGEEFGTN